MKRKIFAVASVLFLYSLCVTSCSMNKTGTTILPLPGPNNDSSSDSVYNAGDFIFNNADGIGFFMIYVPAKNYMCGIDDSIPVTITEDFLIGETEVTYQLWYKVYQWAISRTTDPYTFSTAGTEGDDGSVGDPPSNMEPVANINWRDAIVWCNAATEWYNEKNGTSYSCTYFSDPGYTEPIRESTNDFMVDPTSGCQDHPYIKSDTDGNLEMDNCTSTGFRLLTSYEWELAARYIADMNSDGDLFNLGEYYPGSYASGALADHNNDVANQLVSWYTVNSGGHTHNVKELEKNALGIYDMSGNVSEWCFNWDDFIQRINTGASWASPVDELQIGNYQDMEPSWYSDKVGFRLARTP